MPTYSSVPESKMSDYIKRLFTLADQSNNGIIDAADLEGLLYRSGFNFPSSVIAKVLDGIDTKGDGTVRFEDHVHAVRIICQQAARVNSKASKHRAVVLDLDETAGHWAVGSLAYRIFLKFAGKIPPTEIFVRHYLECGGARPGLRELLKTLEEWKQIGRIDEVAIFTAATNINGWVTFLQECIEMYAGTPGLFQSCITRENSPIATTKAGGMRTIKDLSLVSPDAKQVVLIDDKPDYAINGYVIGVPEYTQDVCITALKKWMKTEIPTHANRIEATFAADHANYPPNDFDFSCDNALWNAGRVLGTVFPSAPTIPVPAMGSKYQLFQDDSPSAEVLEGWQTANRNCRLSA